MSAAAAFDSLYLVAGIARATEHRSSGEVGASEQEVHALAYLACQLAHWTDPELSWGYAFHTTRLAEPFAPEVADALRRLRLSGMVLDAGSVLRPTATGEGFRARTSAHGMLDRRIPFLLAALDAIRFLPIPVVLSALRADPTIAGATSERVLLDETAHHQLAEYFDALSSFLGEGASLLAYVELWLRYLVGAGGVEAA